MTFIREEIRHALASPVDDAGTQGAATGETVGKIDSHGNSSL